MRKYWQILILSLITFTAVTSYTQAAGTERTALFSNDKVSAWKTIIYPSGQQKLTMHRHEHDRVVVAFDDGEFKVVDNKGRTHFMKLVQGQAYYLTKDAPGEMHTDENLSDHPVRVCVVELKT